MALHRRQTTDPAGGEIFDDQGPDLWGSFVGNWTRYSASGFNNGTLTATPDVGDSLSFAFSGMQVVDR